METFAPQVGLATLVAGPPSFDLLTDLAIILCVAAVTTVLFQRLRQPVVLGYLLAGCSLFIRPYRVPRYYSRLCSCSFTPYGEAQPIYKDMPGLVPW